MFTRTKLFLLALLVCGVCHGVLQAQFVKKAQVGFRFLENPVSAEVIGRGSVGVVNTTTVNSIFWNPALLGWMSRDVEVAMNHNGEKTIPRLDAKNQLLDTSKLGIVELQHLSNAGQCTLGLRPTSEECQGYEETGTFTPSALMVGIAFSQKVSTHFSFGVHGKYAHQDLGDATVSTAGSSLSDPALTLEKRNYTKDVAALDVGAYYEFLYNGITFGAVLQNISPELTYENEAFPLPFAVSFGVTVKPLSFFMEEDSTNSLILCFESRHPRDFGEKVKFGAEYRFLNMFAARAGYTLNYDERSWSAGVGLYREISGFPSLAHDITSR